jgi:periplasmic protein TonB
MRITAAFIIALFIHILFFKAFAIYFNEIDRPYSIKKDSNINIKLSYLKTQQPDLKQVLPPEKPVLKQEKIKKELKKVKKTTVPKQKKNLAPITEKKEPEIKQHNKEVTYKTPYKSDKIYSNQNKSEHLKTKTAIPVYKKNPNPKYPEIAKRRGWQGVVMLNVLVSAEGRVKNIKIASGSGYKILDREAFNIVKKWRFFPGMQNDKKIEMWVTVPIRFKLN